MKTVMDVFDIVNYKYKTRTCQQIKISDINYQDFKKLEHRHLFLSMGEGGTLLPLSFKV
jgi:hypothetical protein